MARKRVTYTHNPAGWPLGPHEHGHPGTHACNTILRRLSRGLPPCDHPAIWRVRTASRGLETTAYYCDRHRPKDAP